MGWKRILSHEYYDRIDPKPSKEVQRYVYQQRLCDICSWCAVHLQEDMHWLNMATYWFFLGGVVIGFIQINDTHMHRPVKTAYRQGKIKSMIEKLTENREKKSISNKRENHANNEKGFAIFKHSPYKIFSKKSGQQMHSMAPKITCFPTESCDLLRPQACNFIKKKTLVQMFSCEFCEISKNTFTYRTSTVAVSESFISSKASD